MSRTGTRTAAPWAAQGLLTVAPVSRPMISVPFERFRIRRVADAGRQVFSPAAHARDEARPSVQKGPHWRSGRPQTQFASFRGPSAGIFCCPLNDANRTEEHTSELQSLMRL